MNLKDLLQENNLLQYVEKYCNSLNRIKIDSYEKLQNGGFQIDVGKNKYRILLEKYDNEFCYYGEKLIFWGSYGTYERIPCSTRSQEQSYPKSVGWLGTALAGQANSIT